MTKRNRSTCKFLRLVHTNKSITSATVYPWIELTFDNIYFSSSYFNLSIQSFTGSNHSTKISILPVESDTFSGKLPLLIHVVLIIVVGLVCAFIFYGCVKGQTEEKEREVAEDIDKNMEIEETLLLRRSETGKVVELNEAQEQIDTHSSHHNEN